MSINEPTSRAAAFAERRPARALIRGLAVWLGAGAILALFAWADHRFGCGFFQRGGAAIVIYAILVSVIALRARAEYGEELHAIQLEQCQIAQMMYAEEHEARSDARLRLEREMKPKLKGLDARLRRLAASARLFQDLRVVEGPILVLGTGVWGFGDLILKSAGCALGA